MWEDIGFSLVLVSAHTICLMLARLNLLLFFPGSREVKTVIH